MTDHARNTSLSTQISAAFGWWTDAGVDLQFVDEARSWLAPPVAETLQSADPAPQVQIAPQPEAAPAVAVAGPSEEWPRELAAFTQWWLASGQLDTGGTGLAIPPRGGASPRLMVLVPEPEADDTGGLLSGPQGRLLDNMLSAMGIAESETYIASALPRHTPLADWAGLARSGLAELTLHHIRLAAPERLLVLGRNILPLVSNDPAQNHPVLTEIGHDSGDIPVFAGWDLPALLLRAKARARFWRDWLDWTEGKA